MVELFQAAFSPLNIVYTVLLLMVLAYWLIVIVGVVDLDALDFDVDAGGGLDADAGGGGDLDAASGGAGGFSWLGFFNVGEAPVMFFVSIVFLAMWIVSVQINYAIDSYGSPWMNEHQAWLAAAMALPNLLFSMLLAKLMLEPLKRYRNREPQRTKIVGKVGIVTTEEANEKFGRCELPKHEGSLILNIRTRDGEVLHKGDPVEIVAAASDHRGEYYVATRKQWETAERPSANV